MLHAHRALIGLMMVSGTVPLPMDAQQTPIGAIAPRPDAPADTDAWHSEQCIAGFTYGAPLKWALSYGGGM